MPSPIAEWSLAVLGVGFVAASVGVVLLAWKCVTALSTVTRADARERDRERHDHLRTIGQLVESALAENKERRDLQLAHAQERMDAARLNTTLEANAADHLVREPVRDDRPAPSMGYQ